MVELLTNVQSYFMGHYAQWVLIIVIFIVGIFVIKIADRYLTHFFAKIDFDKTLEAYIKKTIKIFLWIILIIIILSNLGFNVTGFVAGLGIIGFIIGFATKDVLSNLAAGMFLLIKRPFKVGEIVEVSKIKGTVKEMSISSCVVITKENEYVTIPNSKIWGGPIKNLSRLKKTKNE